jgi:hypothetical protein
MLVCLLSDEKLAAGVDAEDFVEVFGLYFGEGPKVLNPRVGDSWTKVSAADALPL